ncbi:O-methyltransferase [Salibacterium aidingense]|uniref:O-methyltransferase n=1 Tax=Salibacterium aidingense TaxID=384933 RepID=UPI003BB9BC41
MSFHHTVLPPAAAQITKEVQDVGFTMNCDDETGALLRTLAASKKSSRFLELGTGAGFSTSWILDGMDKHSSLLTVEYDKTLHHIAEKYLGSDSRVEFVTGDGGEVIQNLQGQSFDFIFADTWPGKLRLLEETLHLVKSGGFYIIDDLLPQEEWPQKHRENIENVTEHLESRKDITSAGLDWSTGLMIAVKT